MTESGAAVPTNGSRWASFISSWKGALVTLAAVFMLGGIAAVRFLGLWHLPEDVVALRNEVKEVRDHDTVQDTLQAQQGRQSVWIICTTIPPNRLDVLIALGVTCPNHPSTGERGFVTPEEFFGGDSL